MSCMSRETRKNAGLGDPPLPFFNNIPESANAMIKRAVNFNESEMSTFCNDMSTLILSQKEDVDPAVINKGPYRLAPKFRSFEVQQNAWFKMNADQRDKHLRKFHEAKMSETENDTNNPSCSVITSESCVPPIRPVRISMDLVELGITSAPVEILRSISSKAEKLLNKDGSIVHAPGSADGTAYIVESYTSTKPHYVSIAKNGKVTCQDCSNWKALKICAHAIAAAEKSGILTKYIKWIRDKGPAHINITALMTSDSSNGTGKKGGKASTARRKGGRKTKRSPVTTVVDRPAFIPKLVTPQPSQRVTTGPPVHTPWSVSATPQPPQRVTTEPPVHTPWSVSATPQPPQRVTTEPPVHTPWSVSATPQPHQRVTTEPPVHTPWSVSATPQPPQRVTMEPPVHTPLSVSATPQPSQRVTTEPPVHTPWSVSATPQPQWRSQRR